MKEKLKDRICEWIASKLPKRVMYYVIIRVWAKLTVFKYPSKCPNEVDVFMALKYLG